MKAKGNSNRELLNRSAINASHESHQISLGKSPDRSKNISVYSHGPSMNLLNTSGKSPYLANNNLMNAQSKTDGRNTSMDGMLAVD